MTTIRVKRTPGEYTTVYTPPYNNAELSWEARGLLAYLLTKPDDWTIQMVDLIKRGPAREFKLKSMIRELKAHGYIERVRTRTKEGKFEWETTVYEKPTIVRFPTDGSPTSGKPTDIISIDLPNIDSPKNQEVAPASPTPDAPPYLSDFDFIQEIESIYEKSPPGDELPMNPDLSKAVPKPPTPQQQMVETLAFVCGMDIKLNGARLGKAASKLIKAGYTSAQVYAGYHPSEFGSALGSWWYVHDWRGRDKFDMPTPEQVLETIGKVKAQPAAPGRMSEAEMQATLKALEGE